MTNAYSTVSGSRLYNQANQLGLSVSAGCYNPQPPS